MKEKLIITLIFVGTLALFVSGTWGFWAHKRINRMAVFTLPPDMIGLYKSNIEYLTDHSIDPDKRRYVDDKEAPRHYIDIDYYGAYPFDELPRGWDSARSKFTEDTLIAFGILPWHLEIMLRRLTYAFKDIDHQKIIKLSAEIGHYLADAHVQLHTSLNYNGQLTGQRGIHGFWESRLPELFGDEYDYFVGKAEYLENPHKEIWKMILESAAAVDSVLKFEKELDASYPADMKFSYSNRGDASLVRTYSFEYASAYNDMMEGMVERRLRKAIHRIGSFWYTAWINAGQPDLGEINNSTYAEPTEKQKWLEKNWKIGKINGRNHSN